LRALKVEEKVEVEMEVQLQVELVEKVPAVFMKVV